MKSHTADERFILALYKIVNEGEDPEAPYNRYEIGRAAALQQTAVNTICKLLIQANFITKGRSGGDDIILTPHGQKLAKTLLEE